jgi:putative transposase
MPRPPRVFARGEAYHLTARGVDRDPIFRTPLDYLSLLALLRDVSDRASWIVHAWCFMTTHYHLIVRTGSATDVSAAMHRLNGIYAREFNLRHDRRGHLFGRRYSPTPIAGDGHLSAACDYVLLNPVTAGIAQNVEDWPWSGDEKLEPRDTAAKSYEVASHS